MTNLDTFKNRPPLARLPAGQPASSCQRPAEVTTEVIGGKAVDEAVEAGSGGRPPAGGALYSTASTYTNLHCSKISRTGLSMWPS